MDDEDDTLDDNTDDELETDDEDATDKEQVANDVTDDAVVVGASVAGFETVETSGVGTVSTAT